MEAVNYRVESLDHVNGHSDIAASCGPRVLRTQQRLEV